MDVAAVMDEVATWLRTISGWEVYAWPVGSASPPAAIVSYPTDLAYDATYGRGMDQLKLPVVVLVGQANDLAARDRLAAYCKGTGASSVKALLESAAHIAFHTLRVESVESDVYSVGGVDYLAAIFTLDIAGSGA